MTPKQAYEKAKKLGKRIPELEPLISKDTEVSCWYALHVIKGRFILGESAISKNAGYSYWYAKYAIKGKLPDFMHNQMIIENNEYTKQYIEYIK